MVNVWMVDGVLFSDIPITDNWDVVGDTEPVTIEDLINFRPTPGVGRMEPTGWAVIGLPTNFWVETGGQIQQGMLLGRLAQVRFIPVSYRWDYGDDTVLSASSRGGSWEELAVDEFEETESSHLYPEAGTYTIGLRTYFGAEYRYNGGEWNRIAGVVPSDSDNLKAIVGTAKTLLVAENCTTDIAGIGC